MGRPPPVRSPRALVYRLTKGILMIGTWLKAERQRRGWSQIELAGRARLPQQTIFHLESPQPPPLDARTLVKLAQAFGISVEDLLSSSGAEAPTGTHVLTEGRVSDWAHLMRELGADLSPDQRAAILERAQRQQVNNRLP